MMTGSASDESRIDAEAVDWVVRQSEGALSSGEEAVFETWRACDPRHARAYAALAQTWREAATLTHLAELVPAQTLAARRAAHAGRGRRIGTRGWSAALAASLVLLVLRSPSDLLTAPVPSPQPAVAAMRSETLPDGSVVTLGPQSEIAVRFSASERRVALISGEAFFEVTHNPAIPFFVEAGDTTVRVVGTKFDVNRAPGSVRVAVQEGVVEVREPSGAAAAPLKTVHILKAGQRLEAFERDATAAPQAASLVLPPVRTTAPGAWRQGWLVYENERLGDLVADVNRYYAPGVRLGADAGDLRVTASFRTTEISSFLDTLGHALPVTIARDADGAFRVDTKPGEERSGRASGQSR